MEDKLVHKTSDEITPRGLTFKLLQDITHSFSEDQKVGQGGYGQVYKGILPDGEEIAVKKLYNMVGINDVQFTNEFNSLMKVKHQNIVRLVGYCFDVQKKPVKLPNGEYVFANSEERALCFEYLPLGSLDNHLSGETSGLDWNTRYKIIKGVCEGLNHLHNGSRDPIYHLDLKPANILLDKNMAPKIADFGLSRLFATTQTHLTTNLKGTAGYMPPEYIGERQISKKFDVYSLGIIIIAIIAGSSGYSRFAEMPSPQQFIQLVHGNWKKRWNATSSNASSDEACSLQLTTCLQIALRCVEKDRAKRPTIREIVDEMNEMDDIIVKKSSSLTAQVYIYI
ncbi:hypothetical protein GUJ93_ZPchr0011g27002 [Zizania palustris]|uniref:Protein kinase domain-containing protein n=1 Tax=Zizania palustris TaxID=103762 RepID=A0A8J5WJ42_ZIZPA|nr:hypothetical protein GUJ93_ZPchr0011g27002 [Zizania palustris]